MTPNTNNTTTTNSNHNNTMMATTTTMHHQEESSSTEDVMVAAAARALLDLSPTWQRSALSSSSSSSSSFLKQQQQQNDDKDDGSIPLLDDDDDNNNNTYYKNNNKIRLSPLRASSLSSSSLFFYSLAPDVVATTTTTTTTTTDATTTRIVKPPPSPTAVSWFSGSSSSSSSSLEEDASSLEDGPSDVVVTTTCKTSPTRHCHHHQRHQRQHQRHGYPHVVAGHEQRFTYNRHQGREYKTSLLLKQQQQQQQQQQQRPTTIKTTTATTTTTDKEEYAAYAGTTISLALPTDSESLSPLHCFMRRYCVQAFSATAADLAIPRYGKSHCGRVRIGQVGIRCLHCQHVPHRHRAERAVCFPSSLENIYHSIETWQRRHSTICRHLPHWIKRSLTELMQKSKAGAGGRRHYWQESARLLGMETVPGAGIRFVRTPGVVDGGLGSPRQGEVVSLRDSPNAVIEATTMVETNESSRPFSSLAVPIVQEQDKALVTEYLYMLLEQMESCRFTEQDRTGGRSKVKDCPVGMAGMQCKHCRGKAGFGRYFPTSVQALASANSDRNIYNHIAKCRKCPVAVRENLQRLQKEQATLKNRRGQRKQFFESVWMRLHDNNNGSHLPLLPR